MLLSAHPKLPMRNKQRTLDFYVNRLGFLNRSASDYAHYLILGKDQIEIHFFESTHLDPLTNDGQVYIRCQNIDVVYQQFVARGIQIHPAGRLEDKPWGQREFSLLDTDNNLLSFGQSL